jgi:trigger factor
MQVTETLNEGLRRKLSVVIPAADLIAKRDERLNELKDRANIKGFRPGKVPVAHLKKVYGRSVMSEALQDTINTTVQESLTERAERAATQPAIDLPEDQSILNQVLEGEADLTFEVAYEVLPKIEPMDFKTIKLEMPVVEVADEDVEKEVKRVFLNNREFERKGDDGVVAEGDKLGLKFTGKINGEPFEGGTSDHAHLTVGAGEYIPGFEEQLVGMKAGEPKEISVTFPEDYGNAELAGKAAVFEVEILHIDAPKEDGELNDAFAQSLGLEDLNQLRSEVRKQMEVAHSQMVRQRVKRQVLDALDDGHRSEVPQKLVEVEFETIWQRVTHEIEHHGRSFADEGTTEEEAREQYKRIAERRVRLGLVIAEIGNRNKIEVTEEEHQQALVAEIRRFPGQEQQVYDYYRKNPEALAQLRAPVFENKVVDFLVELAEKTEKPMTRNELAKLIEEDESEHEVPDEHHH